MRSSKQQIFIENNNKITISRTSSKKKHACAVVNNNLLLKLERFSFECRKVIGFAFTTLRDWLKRLAPLFHPIRSKTKTNCVIG